jgi:hypothetical protein
VASPESNLARVSDAGYGAGRIPVRPGPGPTPEPRNRWGGGVSVFIDGSQLGAIAPNEIKMYQVSPGDIP